MPMQPQAVYDLLKDGLKAQEVIVNDLTGTMDHYKVVVISGEFEGKSLVQRHQMVNQVMAEPLKGPVHALSIDAFTPEQWQEKQEQQSLANQGPTGIKL